jgi:hypothetical protein
MKSWALEQFIGQEFIYKCKNKCVIGPCKKGHLLPQDDQWANVEVQ